MMELISTRPRLLDFFEVGERWKDAVRGEGFGRRRTEDLETRKTKERCLIFFI